MINGTTEVNFLLILSPTRRINFLIFMIWILQSFYTFPADELVVCDFMITLKDFDAVTIGTIITSFIKVK